MEPVIHYCHVVQAGPQVWVLATAPHLPEPQVPGWPAPETRCGEGFSLVLPGFSNQHDGCQAQGKGGGGVVGIAVATQRRLPF